MSLAATCLLGIGPASLITGTILRDSTLACCCEVCDADDPRWHIMRRGDVVVSWACDSHLAGVCEGLQRDHEVTELIVTDSRKARARVRATAVEV
jgi:hypothetical protein